MVLGGILVFVMAVAAFPELAHAGVVSVVGEGEYRLTDHDSRADALRIATDLARRHALEQVAVYVESVTIESAGDLTRDEIRSYSAGVFTTADQQAATRVEGEQVIVHVTLIGTVDPAEVRQAIIDLRASEDARQQMQLLRAEFEDLQERLEQAHTDLAAAESPEQISLATQQRQALLDHADSNIALARAWTGWALGPVWPLGTTYGWYWHHAATLYPLNPHLVVFQRKLPSPVMMVRPSTPAGVHPSLAARNVPLSTVSSPNPHVMTPRAARRPSPRDPATAPRLHRRTPPPHPAPHAGRADGHSRGGHTFSKPRSPRSPGAGRSGGKGRGSGQPRRGGRLQ